MNIPHEFLLPYIITNGLSLIMIWISYKFYRTGKYVFGVIFVLASIFNFYNVIKDTESYLEFGKTAILFFYNDFIFGPFRDHIMVYILTISIIQMFIGLCLFTEGVMESYGIIGGIIFFILIAPLGIGSAFPSTLLMVVALIVTNVRRKNQIRKKMIY